MMEHETDNHLLLRFLEEESEEHFKALVERHSAMVYGCARRIVGDHETAQDVTQAVFILLLRKASTLKSYSSIAGWLYRTTSFMARDALKLSRRREAREQANPYPEGGEGSWSELAVHLDACMESLSDSDRHAILLRFFKNQSLRQVGEALGLSEDTTQKRVARALERLRRSLVGRGIGMTAVTLAGLVSANAATVIPSTTQTMLMTTIASAAHPTPFISTLLKSSLQTLFMTKLKIAATTTLALLLLSGGVGLYVARTQSNQASTKNPMTPKTPLQVLGDLAQAARSHNGAALEDFVHLTNEDRRQRLKSLADWINAVGSFDRACRKAFGDSSTDLALWNSSPQLLYRLDFGQKNLSSAKLQIDRNEARVDIRRDGNLWQFIRFHKVNGVWKIDDEAVDDVASPTDARKYLRLTPILIAIENEVSAGSISTAQKAMEKFRPEAMRIYSAL